MKIRFGILTLSDRSSRGERADSSGPALADLIQAQGWSVVSQALLPDDDRPRRLGGHVAWRKSGATSRQDHIHFAVIGPGD